jgi:hypothetical protein
MTASGFRNASAKKCVSALVRVISEDEVATKESALQERGIFCECISVPKARPTFVNFQQLPVLFVFGQRVKTKINCGTSCIRESFDRNYRVNNDSGLHSRSGLGGRQVPLPFVALTAKVQN